MVSGSSPLTRGKRNSRDDHPDGDRLIPAHAGKTGVPFARSPLHGAHPRSRGENQNGEETTPPRKGSSPLTRGKLGQAQVPNLIGGLIPAHAGKTNLDHRRDDGDKAHPRSRGENPWKASRAYCRAGSSPLTRGKPLKNLNASLGRRLIPAHAGKTTDQMYRSTCSTAHPRSRGENRLRAHSGLVRRGSSPLTRGKRRRHPAGPTRRRLIPAHAGKT